MSIAMSSVQWRVSLCRKFLVVVMLTLSSVVVSARHAVLSSDIRSLEVMVGDDWMAQPVMKLGSNDVLNVGFDELSHNFRRLMIRLEHCEPDWTPSDGLFESDWLEGFNDVPIEDYENSLNTNMLYTHYSFQIPNSQQRIKRSGNYRIHVYDDEDDEHQDLLTVSFMVVEPLMRVGLGVTVNTDIGLYSRYQQVNMTVDYNGQRVTNVGEQLKTVVMQNGREDNMRTDVRPNFVTPQSLKWEHNRQLIFDAGNEYHRFEVLDPTHITFGLDRVSWDEDNRQYHAYPYPVEKQLNYVYTEDADGAFLLRNSDNYESQRTSEYVVVHYKLFAPRPYDGADIIVSGNWTTEDYHNYVMTYDAEDRSYNAAILQKLGYYNYHFLMVDADGTTHPVPEEGSFYQTENKYQALVYFKPSGERSWRLVGYQEIIFRL